MLSTDLLIEADHLTHDQSFDLSKACSHAILADDDSVNEKARTFLINILDNWHKVPAEHQVIWADLLEAAGFYPYISQDRLGSDLAIATAQKIRKAYHQSEHLKNTFLHEEQKRISDLLRQKKNVIVSAPTSFGKSLLIEELVASGKYNNIVVIQPTLALLDETRRKLKKYKDKYKIIVKTSQSPSTDKGNLFLLTAERVMEYPELPTIDCFVLDEFYKLSAKRDDERSDVLNNAFHLLLSHGAQFYLLGPNIDGISLGFADKYNAYFYRTNYSLVDTQEIDIYTKHRDKFDHPIKYKGFKESVLFELLASLSDEQTIVYCSSPERARKLAGQFCEYIQGTGLAEKRSISLVGWIKENIHSSWGMVDCLESGIGIHDGALPKHMNSAVIKYFNEGNLNYLFCTSTIIEGVNTSAKNVVFFDPKKGGRKIDYFDYSNIRGRSGRLMVHYVGKIYNFNKPPKKQNILIDIPFFDQEHATPEILIHLDDNEVKDKTSKDYQKIKSIPDIERKIIQKNGLSVGGQQKIIEILQRDIETNHDLIAWTGTPTYDQINYLVSLAWDNLVKPGESTRPFSKSQIALLTFKYGFDQDINFLVRNQFIYYRAKKENANKTDAEILDDAVRFSFQALRHWFSYKVPKWLLTIDRLQKYVAASKGLKAGDYTFYATQIESDFIRQDLTLLNEYGVPRSAIKKLEQYIGEGLAEEQVLGLVDDLITVRPGLFTDYELEKLKDSV